MNFVANMIVSAIWLPLGLMVQVAALVRFLSVVVVAKTLEALSGTHKFDISDDRSAEVGNIWVRGFRIIWSDNRTPSEQNSGGKLIENTVVTAIVWLPIALFFWGFGFSSPQHNTYGRWSQILGFSQPHVQNFPSGIVVKRSDHAGYATLMRIEFSANIWRVNAFLRSCNRSQDSVLPVTGFKYIDANGALFNFTRNPDGGGGWMVTGECRTIRVVQHTNDKESPTLPLDGILRFSTTEIRAHPDDTQ